MKLHYGVYETVATGKNPHKNLTPNEVFDFVQNADNVEGDEVDTFMTLAEAERCFMAQKPEAFVTDEDVFIASVITLEIVTYNEDEDFVESTEIDYSVSNYEEA